MSETMNMIAAAMRADADALRLVAQNVSNAGNTAYRRQVMVQHASFDAVAGSAAAAQPSGAPQVLTVADQRFGTLKGTDETFDVAIEGAAFFVVATPQGEALTRRGDFHVDAAGMLVAATGNQVLGAAGPIHIGTARPTIQADGTVNIDGAPVDRLRLVETASPQSLQPLGDGLFLPPPEVHMFETESARVRQGFLEGSNVSAIDEVMRMMEVMRHFETAQRFARGYDDILTSAITQLGKV